MKEKPTASESGLLCAQCSQLRYKRGALLPGLWLSSSQTVDDDIIHGFPHVEHVLEGFSVVYIRNGGAFRRRRPDS